VESEKGGEWRKLPCAHVAWDKVTRPLKLGGLGIPNLQHVLGSSNQMDVATKNRSEQAMAWLEHPH
jgi:hypothetical protein